MTLPLDTARALRDMAREGRRVLRARQHSDWTDEDDRAFTATRTALRAVRALRAAFPRGPRPTLPVLRPVDTAPLSEAQASLARILSDSARRPASPDSPTPFKVLPLEAPAGHSEGAA